VSGVGLEMLWVEWVLLWRSGEMCRRVLVLPSNETKSFAKEKYCLVSL